MRNSADVSGWRWPGQSPPPQVGQACPPGLQGAAAALQPRHPPAHVQPVQGPQLGGKAQHAHQRRRPRHLLRVGLWSLLHTHVLVGLPDQLCISAAEEASYNCCDQKGQAWLRRSWQSSEAGVLRPILSVMELIGSGCCAGTCDRLSSVRRHKVSMRSSCSSSRPAPTAFSMDILKLEFETNEYKG